MVNVVVVAHCPAVGVNVYVVVIVLFNAGSHVPLIPLRDVVGNGANMVPEQIGATGLNVGVTGVPNVETVILNMPVHPLASFAVMIYAPAANAVNILLA
jgi:hypothetical protein